ncbi:MAG: hypothetical protein AB1508_15970 [Pseudomonadota bacterium]
MRKLLTAAGMIVAFLVPILSLNLFPPRSGAVAVIVNPLGGLRAADVIAAADGRLLRGGVWPWIAVGIKSTDKNFAEALFKAGAIFVGSPILAVGCQNAR